MKKTQKKLGNKGFSLVELIVVIAIMAVLVGVLAPTLIRNVEKSRESKDAQNVDQIKSALEVALQKEDAYASAVPATGATAATAITINASGVVVSNTTVSDAIHESLDVTSTKPTSKKFKAATITFTVDDQGHVATSGVPALD